jgi:Fe-S cluster assembly protein SufD
LNTAFANEGAYQYPKSKVSKPIEIMYFSTGTKLLYWFNQNLVIVGENAQLQIIERHQSLNEIQY